MLTVETSKPLFSNPDQILKKIGSFWDGISVAWEKVWGQHIHHGFYDNNHSRQLHTQVSCSPQELLIQKIIEAISLEKELKILDVGCGLGGSSIYLAKHCQATVVGITLSPKQIEMAKKSAAVEKVNASTTFLIENAHSLKEFQDKSFDLVWSLESCEQFYDKALFIEQAYRVLKPGGKLMIATWCSDKEHYAGSMARRYIKLCKDFDLPYMPTQEYYSKLLQSKFILSSSQDWSAAVKNSWNLGIQHLKQFSWLELLKLLGLRGLRFVRSLRAMSDAFLSGQLRYAVFIAIKR